MTIECHDCDGTGAHDFTGFTGEIETETCKGCDGTGNAICDKCDNAATHKYEDYISCDECDIRPLIRGDASGKT